MIQPEDTMEGESAGGGDLFDRDWNYRPVVLCSISDQHPEHQLQIFSLLSKPNWRIFLT